MNRLFFLLALAFNFSISQAQISFQTEYLGRSHYKLSQDNKTRQVGNSSGSAVVYQGSINLPLTIKEDERGLSSLWMISATGAMAKLDNKHFTPGLVIDEILNINFNLVHRARVDENWSYLAVAGAGIYTPTTQISEIEARNILGNAAVVFIRTPKPNLEWGFGLALNNTFGYPMVFPALYFDWYTKTPFAIKVQMIDGVEALVDYTLTAYLSLGLGAEIKGQMATLKQEGKNKIFTHQYITSALRPEFKLGALVSIPLAVGIQARRNTQMSNRSLKNLFQGKEYYFDLAAYLSAGVKVGF